MIPVTYGPPSLVAIIWRPWRFDRIEVTGRRYTEPSRGHWFTADDDRASAPVSFSLVGEWFCEFPSGANLVELAGTVARMIGPGCYGIKSARRTGFQNQYDIRPEPEAWRHDEG